MVLVQEEDGNEWLGKITTRDVKVKASNPYKYMVEDKYGKGYRVDLLDENWKWHQVQEEVLLVMLPRSEHNTRESMKAEGDRRQHAHREAEGVYNSKKPQN